MCVRCQSQFFTLPRRAHRLSDAQLRKGEKLDWHRTGASAILEALETEALVIALAVALTVGVLGWLVALGAWRRGVALRFERDLLRDRVRDTADFDARARDAFEALAGQTLRRSNAEFLTLARETLRVQETRGAAELEGRRVAVEGLVRPIGAALEKTHAELERLGRENAGLRAQVKGMLAANRELAKETGKLSQALRRPNVRGRYGEIQLERVVELAGMRPYCDFSVQETVHGEASLRPDLVVRLPNDRIVVVDAKTPIDGYLDAVQTRGSTRAEHLARFAAAVVDQVDRLSRKEYWAQFERSPEFVVMFVPGDQLVDAALRERPDLLEHAARRDVILASPSTLIGLLRAVHAGWREKRLEDGARKLFELGRELHRRAASVLGHTDDLGGSLRAAVERYNLLVGSLEQRLVPTLRRFEESGAGSSKELVEPRPVDAALRDVALPESAADPRDAEGELVARRLVHKRGKRRRPDAKTSP